MKIFLDANILVSATLRDSAADNLVTAMIRGDWRLVVSEYVVAETVQVATTKLHAPIADVNRISSVLRRIAIWSSAMPSRHIVHADPADTPVLQAALTASADFLVTRDKGLLKLDPYETIRIVCYSCTTASGDG